MGVRPLILVPPATNSVGFVPNIYGLTYYQRLTDSLIKPNMDLRVFSGPIEAQGNINACGPNAVVAGCEMYLVAADQFQHLSRRFNYYEARDAYDSTGTTYAVTFQDSGDTVTRTAHGLLNGQVISFSAITTTTGISVNVPYYVVNKTTNTFQVSLTYDGTALALTSNGSGYMTYDHNVVGSDGTILRLCVDAVVQVGLPTEELFPYTLYGYNDLPPDAVYTDAATRKLTAMPYIFDGYGDTDYIGHDVNWGGYKWLSDVKSAITERYPVAMALNITTQFLNIEGDFDYQFANPYLGLAGANTDVTPIVEEEITVIAGQVLFFAKIPDTTIPYVITDSTGATIYDKDVDYIETNRGFIVPEFSHITNGELVLASYTPMLNVGQDVGHAVLFVGYSAVYQSFIIQNSWGGGWGYGGYALLPYEACKDCFEGWVLQEFDGLAIPDPASITTTPDVPTEYLPTTVPTTYVDPVYYFQGAENMAITASDLKWRAAKGATGSPSTNGGLIDLSSDIVSGSSNTLFPNVSLAERTSGKVTHRKVFLSVAKSPSEELLNPYLHLADRTPAGDFVYFRTGTATDTESTMLARDDRTYGSARTTGSTSSAATTVVVQVETEATNWAFNASGYTNGEPFKAGDMVYISDGTHTEYLTIDTVDYSASPNITITLTVGVSYTYAAGTKVASVYQYLNDASVASVLPSVNTPTVTSSAGTFDATKITLNSKGCIDQTWTVEKHSDGYFWISGDTLGTYMTNVFPNTGVINPYHASMTSSAPYFSIATLAWGGTWATGDKVVFTTKSASIPVWLTRIVPAGCSSISSDSITVIVQAESY